MQGVKTLSCGLRCGIACKDAGCKGSFQAASSQFCDPPRSPQVQAYLSVGRQLRLATMTPRSLLSLPSPPHPIFYLPYHMRQAYPLGPAFQKKFTLCLPTRIANPWSHRIRTRPNVSIRHLAHIPTIESNQNAFPASQPQWRNPAGRCSSAPT